MRLIDRYVLAVSEYLPEHMREDVSKELLGNIEDMLPENSTEEQERAVLKELGNPRKLAREYNSEKRYLIGPESYDTYLMVLKFAIIIMAVITFVGELVSTVIEPMLEMPTINITVKLITDMFVNVLQEVLLTGFWVTLIFAINERYQSNQNNLVNLFNGHWSIDNLPTTPRSSKRKISRGETFFSLIFTVVFVILISSQGSRLFGVYSFVNDGQFKVVSFFNLEALDKYMVAFVIVGIIEVFMAIWKLIGGYWNNPIAICNTIHNVIVAVIVILMFRDQSLMNPDFLAQGAEVMKITLTKMTEFWSMFTVVFLIIFVLITAWDSFDGLWRANKK